jgi:hypothetical protein
MSQVIIAGDTSGTITLQAPAVAGSTTLTLPAATGTVMVSGNMPTFSYYQSSAQTLSAATFTKITFTSSATYGWDTTGGMYASSRFTPTISGYYQINGAVYTTTSQTSALCLIYKNGSAYKQGYQGAGTGLGCSGVVYCNGSTDYIEIYAYLNLGGTLLNSNSQYTWFDGSLIRNA